METAAVSTEVGADATPVAHLPDEMGAAVAAVRLPMLVTTAVATAAVTEETMTEDGRLTAYANPWARRVLEDLKALLTVEDAELFLSELRITTDKKQKKDTHSYIMDLFCETEAASSCYRGLFPQIQ